MRSASVLLFGIACGVTSPAPSQTNPAAGQADIGVVPYIGLYWPTNALGSGGGDTTVKHRISPKWGLRVTVLGRWGVEGTIGYTRSSLVSSYEGAFPAHVWTVSATVLHRLTPRDARVTRYVGGGLSLIGHGGDAYPPSDYRGPKTFVGGIASAGEVIKLARWMEVRFDAEDVVYLAHLGPCTRTGPGSGSVCDVFSENAARTTNSRLQNDLVLSLAVALVSAGRPTSPQ